ncbi:hypothetical protein JZ751_024437, partial [Albula glossodonta]
MRCSLILHYTRATRASGRVIPHRRGTFRGVCKKIDHFPQDADYEQDAAEYLLRAVRASSIFPIMSVGLLFMGGLCIAASEFYKTQHNVILSAGIFFVSAGEDAMATDRSDMLCSDSKKSYSYGWSFYFGALSFIMAEMVGVLAVHMFIEKHRRQRAKSRTELIKKPQSAAAAFAARIPSYRYRFRRRSSCPSSEPNSSRDTSPVGKGFTGPAGAPPSAADISMYTLSRDPGKAPPGGGGGPLLNSEMEFLQGKDSDPPDFKEALQGNAANRRTTPVFASGGTGAEQNTTSPDPPTPPPPASHPPPHHFISSSLLDQTRHSTKLQSRRRSKRFLGETDTASGLPVSDAQEVTWPDGHMAREHMPR